MPTALNDVSALDEPLLLTLKYRNEPIPFAVMLLGITPINTCELDVTITFGASINNPLFYVCKYITKRSVISVINRSSPYT